MSQSEIQRILEYEIGASSWWVGWISWPWLQDRVGNYFARKVRRKYRRWKANEAIAHALIYEKSPRLGD